MLFDKLKGFEFKKSKYPVAKIAFFLVIFFSVLSIIFTLWSYKYSFDTRVFNNPLEPVKITLETQGKFQSSSMLFCYNDYCESPSTNVFNTYYESEFSKTNREFFRSKVKSLYLIYPFSAVDFPDKINSLDIHIGAKNYYYSACDIKKFTRKTVEFKSVDNSEAIKYNALIIPQINNYKGVLSHIKILFLSLFDNWYIFIIPYFWLFCAYLIYIFNKEEFNFKFSIDENKVIYLLLGLVIFVAIFLRWSDISYYPLYIDEIYTKTIISKFSASTLLLRLPSFIFGVLLIPLLFLLFKNINKKLALFASFFAAVNIVNIYYSQVALKYSFLMFLSVVLVYLLFNYLKKPNIKNLICYTIALLFLTNGDYYLILFAISCFIWGIVDILSNKELTTKTKKLFGFVISNLLSFCVIIPCYIINHEPYTKVIQLSKETFLNIINTYFINKYVFLALAFVVLFNLFLCFLPKNLLAKMNLKINSDKENLFIFLIYSITLVLILSSAISIFYKPILDENTVISMYSLLLLLEVTTIASVVDFINYNKIPYALKSAYSLLLVFVCFTITKPIILQDIFNLDNFMTFVEKDAPRYQKDYEIYVLTKGDDRLSKIYPKTYDLKYLNWRYIDNLSDKPITKIKRKDYTNSKKVVVYFNSIGVDIEKVSTLNPFLYVHEANLATCAKVVFDND